MSELVIECIDSAIDIQIQLIQAARLAGVDLAVIDEFERILLKMKEAQKNGEKIWRLL
jgi:hypothetical protein